MKHIPRLELYEDVTKEKQNEFIIFRYPSKHRKSENPKMETQKTINETRKTRKTNKKKTRKTNKKTNKRKNRTNKKSLFAFF